MFILRDYSRHVELQPFLRRRLSFWATFHALKGAVGETPRKCLSFALTGPLETCFYGQENSRKRKE